MKYSIFHTLFTFMRVMIINILIAVVQQPPHQSKMWYDDTIPIETSVIKPIHFLWL